MLRTRKQSGSDEPPGAPEWMVTFSDCMTLLLTFFVLLLSFSSFDDKVFRKLDVIYADAMPAVSPAAKKDKDAFLSTKQIEYTEELRQGSEKPTLAEGKETNLKQETNPDNFHSRKVFLISSKKVFWGKGTIISFQGRKTLKAMASFLREVPSRVVISENSSGLGGDNNAVSGQEDVGLRRAWAAMKYLTTKQGLDKKWFSISARSTVPVPSQSTNNKPGHVGPEAERGLEIILLERSIYH